MERETVKRVGNWANFIAAASTLFILGAGYQLGALVAWNTERISRSEDRINENREALSATLTTVSANSAKLDAVLAQMRVVRMCVPVKKKVTRIGEQKK